MTKLQARVAKRLTWLFETFGIAPTQIKSRAQLVATLKQYVPSKEFDDDYIAAMLALINSYHVKADDDYDLDDDTIGLGAGDDYKLDDDTFGVVDSDDDDLIRSLAEMTLTKRDKTAAAPSARSLKDVFAITASSKGAMPPRKGSAAPFTRSPKDAFAVASSMPPHKGSAAAAAAGSGSSKADLKSKAQSLVPQTAFGQRIDTFGMPDRPNNPPLDVTLEMLTQLVFVEDKATFDKILHDFMDLFYHEYESYAVRKMDREHYTYVLNPKYQTLRHSSGNVLDVAQQFDDHMRRKYLHSSNLTWTLRRAYYIVNHRPTSEFHDKLIAEMPPENIAELMARSIGTDESREPGDVYDQYDIYDTK